MDTRTSRTEQPRPHDDYYLGWIAKMAAAANVELSEATLAMYLERLRKLSAQQIETASRRTIEEWQEASKMPPLSFILERCWAQTAPRPFQGFKQIANKSGITREEVREWLKGGKEMQREYQRMLAEDPSMAGRYEQAITEIRERLAIRC